jgi:hypothetical protein
MSAAFDPILGRYLRLEIGDQAQRLYVQEACGGIPVLCLHTVGAEPSLGIAPIIVAELGRIITAIWG